MATRLYFPLTQAAPVTPPAGSGTDWEHISSPPTRALLLTPDSSTLTTTAVTPDAADDLTDRDTLHRQYVSDPLKAQTLSGNVKAQFQVLEELANCNLSITLKILVCNNSGSTTQATLRAITRDTTEANTSLRNLTWASVALTNFACSDGDRLVVEVGLGGNITSGTGGTVGHNGSIRWGCNASGGDLAENDTETGTTFRPWIEFANTIKWLGEADGSSSGVAASAVAGVALWATVMGGAGVATASADGDTVKGDATTLSVVAFQSPRASWAATWQAYRQHQIAAEVVAGPIEADGASAGVATVSGVGVAFTQTAGASDGVATVSGVGVARWESVGSSAGLAAVAALSRATAGAVSASAGIASVSGIGEDANAGGAAGTQTWWPHMRRRRR